MAGGLRNIYCRRTLVRNISYGAMQMSEKKDPCPSYIPVTLGAISGLLICIAWLAFFDGSYYAPVPSVILAALFYGAGYRIMENGGKW